MRGLVALAAFVACCSVLAGCSQPSPSEQRKAAIYTAVIKAFLRDGPTGAPPPRRAYVESRAFETAGWGAHAGRQGPGQPIDEAVQDAVTEGLEGTIDVLWVADVYDAFVPGTEHSGCAKVRDADLVITVDRLPATGDRLQVSASAVGPEGKRDGCSAAWLSTYVVKHRAGGWRVTGNTGLGGTS